MIDRHLCVAHLSREPREEVVAAGVTDGPMPEARSKGQQRAIENGDHVEPTEMDGNDREIVQCRPLCKVAARGIAPAVTSASKS